MLKIRGHGNGEPNGTGIEWGPRNQTSNRAEAGMEEPHSVLHASKLCTITDLIPCCQDKIHSLKDDQNAD
jgi:hypothetical protein